MTDDLLAKYGHTTIRQLADATTLKIIDNPNTQMHLHRHPGGLTISLYDKATGAPALNDDGTPQRFTWPSSRDR